MPVWGRRASVLIDTLKVEGLDVRFAVTLQADNLGKAQIEVYNLNEAHRKEIAGSRSFDVVLSVGYEDQDLTGIFKGTIRQASSRREAPDWITTLKSGDGDKVAAARVDQSYPAGTTFETVWKDLVDAFGQAGIGAGNAIAVFKKGTLKDGITQLIFGGTSSGQALERIKKLGRAAGLHVDIQNNELVVTQVGLPLDAEVVVLSPSSGLIGSPEKAMDADGKPFLKARSLILPGLLPRRKVKVQSTLVNGLHVVHKVDYRGDTAGQDWYADLECTAL